MPKKRKFFVVVIFLLCFALCISFAELFSSLLTIGDFAFLPSSSAKSSGYEVFALSINKATTQQQAELICTQVTQENGAGYIYLASDNIYYVLASAYENKADAEKVLQQNPNQTHAEIVTISVPEISISLTLSGKEKVAFNNALSIFKTCFKTLYDLSVSLDTEVKSETDCKLLISDLKAQVSKVQSDFDTYFNSRLDQNSVAIKLKITSLSSLLQSLIENQATDIPFSSTLKYSYIKIIFENIDICNTLS